MPRFLADTHRHDYHVNVWPGLVQVGFTPSGLYRYVPPAGQIRVYHFMRIGIPAAARSRLMPGMV